MPESIDQRCSETLRKLKQELSKQQDGNASNEEIKHAIFVCLKQAFDQVAAEDRKALYKKMSRWLHQDKLANSNESFALFLRDRDLLGLPQQVLNKFNEKNVSLDKTQIDFFTFNEKTVNMLTKMLNPFKEDYKRYYQPVRGLVYTISLLISIGLAPVVAAALISFLIIMLAMKIAYFFTNGLINFFTAGEYDVFVQEYTENEYPAAKTRFINDSRLSYISEIERLIRALEDESSLDENESSELLRLRTELEQLKAYSDEQFLRQLALARARVNEGGGLTSEQAEQAYAEVENGIRKSIAINGLTQLNFIAKSFAKAILSSLPQGILGKLGAIFIVKPIQVITAPVLFLLASIIELVKFVNGALMFGVFGAATIIKAFSLIILNAPLYLLDGCSYLVSLYRNSSVPQLETEQDFNASGSLLLMDKSQCLRTDPVNTAILSSSRILLGLGGATNQEQWTGSENPDPGSPHSHRAVFLGDKVQQRDSVLPAIPVSSM